MTSSSINDDFWLFSYSKKHLKTKFLTECLILVLEADDELLLLPLGYLLQEFQLDDGWTLEEPGPIC